MSKEPVKTRLIRCGVVLLLFSILVVVLGFLLWGIKPHVISYITKHFSKDEDSINLFFNGIAILTDLILGAIFTAWLKKYIELWLNPLEITICADQSVRESVSGVQSEVSSAIHPRIVVGRKSRQLRIVHANIVNTGNRNIAQCIIEGQTADDLFLRPNDERKLYFLVEDLEENTDSEVTYYLSYSLLDNYGLLYTGQYQLVLNLHTHQAMFRKNKKSR